MLSFFRGYIVFKIFAFLSFLGAVVYGDAFWYLAVFLFSVFAFGFRKRASYVTEERTITESVTPNAESSENIVVSRLSRRRVR